MSAEAIFAKLLAVAADEGVHHTVSRVIDAAKAKHPELREAPRDSTDESIDARIDRELAKKLNG